MAVNYVVVISLELSCLKPHTRQHVAFNILPSTCCLPATSCLKQHVPVTSNMLPVTKLLPVCCSIVCCCIQKGYMLPRYIQHVTSEIETSIQVCFSVSLFLCTSFSLTPCLLTGKGINYTTSEVHPCCSSKL